MKSPIFCAVLAITWTGALIAGETHQESFDGDARPENWKVQFGHWEPEDGALVCRQLEADNHPAASRWITPFTNGVVEARLKLGEAKAFHFGFDPKPGTLKKKGHLYSLVITAKGAQIMKHKDKANPLSKNVVLAEGLSELPTEEWIGIRLEAKDDMVFARVGESIKLEVRDETFGVPKPAVVFRCIGGDALLDVVAVVVKD